ncbi:MAG: hypothetical protein IJT37_06075 [Lachnospiraceae bacterium]|nr:hypothetical protein [Lachnospiraceae bacterium]
MEPNKNKTEYTDREMVIASQLAYFNFDSNQDVVDALESGKSIDVQALFNSNEEAEKIIL